MTNDSNQLKIEGRAGKLLTAMLRALESESTEVQTRVMMACGKECARLPCPPEGQSSLDLVAKIVERTSDVKERIELLNQEVPWCAEWICEENTIFSECYECGCLLVQSELIKDCAVWCDCSIGWVKEILEALLQLPVKVELVSAIGRGDKTCKYLVKIPSESNKVLHHIGDPA
jgi:predicted hydrocarbon binding protein